MALTNNRRTTERSGSDNHDPVAAGKIIYMGALVVLDAAGNLAPGSTAPNLAARGVATEYADNSAGAAGDLSAPSRTGVFILKNDGSIDRTHIESNCYIVDDETVAATDGALTRSVAGRITDVTTAGVSVKIG